MDRVSWGPCRQGSARGADVVGAARVGEANPRVPARGVEVEAGRRREADLVEPPRTQVHRVVGQMRHVGVDVERTIRIGDSGDTRCTESLEQQRSVAPIALDVAVELVLAIEGGESDDLADMR